MLTRRSFLPSFFGGAAAALVPAAALAIPAEKTGYQRLSVHLFGVTPRTYCVRLTESQLLAYNAWLMDLCDSATMIKSVDETNPENALSFDEVRAAVAASRTETVEDEGDDVTCDRCGWVDDLAQMEDGCYNCGA